MLALDSRAVEPGDRNAALNAAINSREVPQRVRYVSPPQAVRHRVHFFELGPGAHLIRSTGTGIHIVRGIKEVRRGAPEQVSVLFQHRGCARLEVDGEQYTEGEGDLSLTDTTRPYTYRQSELSEARVLILDPALLALPPGLIRRAGHSLAVGPLYPLVQRHFSMLGDVSDELPPEAAALLGRATCQLVAALITMAVGDRRQQEALHDSLLLRITMYIDDHLADPGLSAGEIAAAHHISLRQLYNVWSRSGRGEPPTEWILRRRLERARDQLTGLDAGKRTIAAIAQANGFCNASHFTARFRHAFGVTPGEWRRLSRT